MTLKDYGTGFAFALIFAAMEGFFSESGAFRSNPVFALIFMGIGAVPLGWVGAYGRRKLGERQD